MRLLLDECIPRQFKNELSRHDCRTVPEEGMAGKKNGELLPRAEEFGFEVFLTLDRGLQYQQNLQHKTIAIILIRSKSSRLVDLLPHSAEFCGCSVRFGQANL
jgi:hypothetical protein